MSTLHEIDAPELAKFVVHNPPDVAAILMDLRTRRARPSIYYGPDEADTCLSLILEVDMPRRRFVFDIDRSEAVNHRIAAAESLRWMCWLEGIRVEFTCARPERVILENGPAFVAPFPERALRMQRRNAFRAPAPVTQPLICRIDPTGTGKVGLPLRVVDLSTLGMCLLVDIEELPWTAGATVKEARLDLPDYGTLFAGFEVRYIIPAGARHPATFRRCGVQFAGLSARDSVSIQRYINDLQRERAKTKLT